MTIKIAVEEIIIREYVFKDWDELQEFIDDNGIIGAEDLCCACFNNRSGTEADYGPTDECLRFYGARDDAWVDIGDHVRWVE